jgi:hypothetical protein
MESGPTSGTHCRGPRQYTQDYNICIKKSVLDTQNLNKPMVSQLNTNAIKYAMNILLYKRKLENNQPVPIIPN